MESFNFTREQPAKKKIHSLLTKFVTMFAVGLTAFSQVEASDKENLSTPTKIEQVEGNQILHDALKVLNNPSLTVGERKILAIKNMSGGVGIYTGSRHIGDVYSRPMQKFEADIDYFLFQVQKLLDEAKESYTPIKREELTVSPEALSKMDELGISHSEQIGSNGKKVLVLGFNDGDKIEIDMDSDGDDSSYGKLKVDNTGKKLIFSGVSEDKPYYITITKGVDGKITTTMRNPGPEPIINR